MSIKLIRSAERLPLTSRQAEICVLMAEGFSHEAIAERLAISRHTVNQHGRWIYDKLEAHNRSELVTKLVSGWRQITRGH
jgi:DNA-binding CsgD family transcriptional regulator